MARVFMLAGEPSGDLYAGIIARDVLQLSESTVLTGVVGPEMLAAGVRPFKSASSISDLGVFGFWEGIRNAGNAHRLAHSVREHLKTHRSDVFVPISYSGVNLPVARYARSLSIPVMYLAPPQVWAWGRNRVHSLRRAADQAICILPFELEFLRRAGVNAGYLGNPLVDIIAARPASSDGRSGISRGRRLLLMPGSRESEIRRHLPLMREVAARLRAESPDIEVLEVERPTATDSARFSRRYGIMREATVILAASGTATLEAALMQVPTVVIYRLSAPSYMAARLVVKLKRFSLPNLILGRTVVPEFIQPVVSEVHKAVRALLDNPELRSRMRAELAEVRKRLGPSGASLRIARAVLAAAHRQA
jgi:lipid-A-disaccharide synthase